MSLLEGSLSSPRDADDDGLFEVGSSGNHRQIFLAPCSNDHAERHFQKTVIQQIDVSRYRDLIPEEFDGTLSIWGTGEGNASTAEQLERGDLVLFYRGNRTYTHAAVVLAAEQNEQLDSHLWTPYGGTLKKDGNESWPYVFYLSNPIEVNIDSVRFHSDLGYNDEFPLGFRRVADHRVENLSVEYGSIDTYIEQVRNTAEGFERERIPVDMYQGDEVIESGTDDSSESTSDEQVNLEELREQAEEASEEKVTSTTVSTTQYNRSAKVKRYARARADGVCEGCEEAAPFTNRSGDPYLEVHHVYEVSDEGPDRPDAVVALCPTCHSRIHHGEDGNEYNEQLIEKLETELEPADG